MALVVAAGCSRRGGTRQGSDQSEANQAETLTLVDASRYDPAVLALLGANSKECLSCAEQNCQNKMNLCQQIDGRADAGPAKGQARRQLCLDTLDCIIKSRCVGKVSAMGCYCGGHNVDECLAGKSNGACKSRIEKGHESTDAGTIARDWYDEKTGGSSAMGLVMCLVNRGCSMCF